MKKKKLIIITLALLAVLLTACSGNTPEMEGGIMSSFKTESLTGEAIDESVLSDYKLTVVNVWATYCTPCIQEMPDLGELASEYESKGVQMIGLVSDVLDSKGTADEGQISLAKDIVSQTKANYLHIIPSPEFYGILGSIPGVPTTFFVNSEGEQVGTAYVGAKSKEAWKAIIDGILAEVSE